MAPQKVMILVVFFLTISSFCQGTINDQSQFFALLKKSVSTGNSSLSDWDGKPICNYSGIGCDDQGNVTKIDLSGWSLSGLFPHDVCSFLPGLRILRLGHNNFQGTFPSSISNCSLLEELNMVSTSFTGPLPDFSPLQSLRLLNLSNNHFTGEFPLSIINLTNLELLDFNENRDFNPWQLPENISRLTKLRWMILTACKLLGGIPASIGNMTSLVDLELSENRLTGRIPRELGRLKKLKMLELYYNQLEGEIPEELGNLTELVDLDMRLSCLPCANSTTLTILSLHDNYLTGEIPQNFGVSSALLALDLSENELSGQLPAQLCHGGKLMYILLLQTFSLEKAMQNVRLYSASELVTIFWREEYQKCFLLFHMLQFIDLSYNNLTGSIPTTIGNTKNLSELFMQSNMLSGTLPPEISTTSNLVKIDLSNNLLSGPIPSEIGNLKKLNLFFLQGLVLFLKRWFRNKRRAMENEDSLSSSFVTYDVKSFHRLSFDEREIFEAMIEKNIVGYGGLLVYQNMPNGNLGDALHGGKILLDWPIHHRIALGIAQGLAYLHHDLLPPIIHRDIKTTNILLDVDYQPKVADFGMAKVLQATGGKDCTTTVIAGTYGYLAPEYAYSSKETTKCDVYSFGSSFNGTDHSEEAS
ncbi:hypothetical protein K7X08_006892 [Anisodus acutangulus]|uniref:non-specific serine/threonine protein kinase n=1 Tax=Anisodus acutangulus TaxID=402998 RepID=A0A9Q1QZE0_9SOLA|nr:hypothetical protein K7X08_006892 [Anisodus acutangulus]